MKSEVQILSPRPVPNPRSWWPPASPTRRLPSNRRCLGWATFKTYGCNFVALRSAIARVSVRPSLIAYLVVQGDREQYLDAVSFAATEWGGYAHPIIPISHSGRIAPPFPQVLKDIGPDVIAFYPRRPSRRGRRLGARSSSGPPSQDGTSSCQDVWKCPRRSLNGFGTQHRGSGSPLSPGGAELAACLT